MLAPLAWADSAGEPGRGSNGPNPLNNVYFGEQHMHTQNSFDAWTIGVRGTWAEAYEFALGKPSKLSTTGEKMQRKTPYDFVAITDHAEYYGVFKNMADPKSPLSKTDFAKQLASSNPKQVQAAAIEIIATIADNDPVKDFIKGADKYKDPGNFTPL